MSANGEEEYNFCLKDFHFLKTFESFLLNLVRAGEITEKFDNLNKLTASKIERFIKDKVAAHHSLLEAQERVKVSVREFDGEFRRQLDKLKDRQLKRKQDFLQELELYTGPQNLQNPLD
jgi:hypothetical protein